MKRLLRRVTTNCFDCLASCKRSGPRYDHKPRDHCRIADREIKDRVDLDMSIPDWCPLPEIKTKR